MKTEELTCEQTMRWICTYEGNEVSRRAEEIVAENPARFLNPDGVISARAAIELREEAWRTCEAVEDYIPLPNSAFFWKGNSIPIAVILDWIGRRYGELAKVCAAMLFMRHPSEFADQIDSLFIREPLKLRDGALGMIEDGSSRDLAMRLCFGF